MYLAGSKLFGSRLYRASFEHRVGFKFVWFKRGFKFYCLCKTYPTENLFSPVFTRQLSLSLAMGKESHSGAGKRKGSSSSSSNQKNISSKSEDEVNEKWKSSSKTKGKAGSKASSRNYTKAEPSGGKSGRRVLYLSMLVTVLAIIVWPLSRYCGVDKELWRPVEFVQNFLSVQREQPRVEVPEKQHINIWTLDRRCGLSLEEFIDTYDGKR